MRQQAIGCHHLSNEVEDHDRAALGFSDAAQRAFAFMTMRGFTVVEASPTLVRFSKQGWLANVYHGRRSYEVGFEIGPGEEQFSLSAVIGITDPEAAERFRYPVARTAGQIANAMTVLADAVRAYAMDALDLRPEFAARLRDHRQRAGQQLELDVLEHQQRPKAEAAFRQKQWADAVRFYESFEARLTATEKLKLATARKRAVGR
jgi:hypothetical protein